MQAKSFTFQVNLIESIAVVDRECNSDCIQDVDSEDVRCQIARAKGHVIDLTLLRPGDNKVVITSQPH